MKNKFTTLVTFILTIGVVAGECEANNPMPMSDPTDDYMYGSGGGVSLAG